MAAKKKVVTSGSTRIDDILDAAEKIMLKDGYAAVSSRKVAAKAGLQSQLLHYYFRTMDDLFIAMYYRLEDRYDEEFARAVAADHPIQQLWKLNTNLNSACLVSEFKALAIHRKPIRALIARSARRDRGKHVAVFTQLLERDAGLPDLSPMILTFLLTGAARMLVTDGTLGISDGHAELLQFIKGHLRVFANAKPKTRARLPRTSKPKTRSVRASVRAA
jgi:TetR/AcrR family transcriptional regulator